MIIFELIHDSKSPPIVYLAAAGNDAKHQNEIYEQLMAQELGWA